MLTQIQEEFFQGGMRLFYPNKYLYIYMKILPYSTFYKTGGGFEKEEEKKKQSPLEKPKKQVKTKSNEIIFYN